MKHKTIVDRLIDAAKENERLTKLEYRREVWQQHKADCIVCLTGGDCTGPFNEKTFGDID